jgi:hypothetical protein
MTFSISLLTILGAGGRLREAVRNVTDGTLGLLSKSLPTKTSNYIKTGEGTKSPARRPSTNSANAYSSNTQSYTYDSNAAANGNTAASSYLPPDGQMTHQPTPYPAATQYPGYADNSSGSSTIAYTPQDTHSYTNYPTSTTDPVEAPLLAAFAAQAAQTQPSTWRAQPHNVNPHSGSQAWQQWTSTVAGNLEPQDCYSASALMQLGGREGNGNGNIPQPGTSLGEMTSSQAVTMEQNVGHLGGQMTGGIGMSWPLNIFDLGHGGGQGT